jgi:hypothetical protein
MILTQTQASVIYYSMCALNTVGGILKVTLPIETLTPGTFIRVMGDKDKGIQVMLYVNHLLEETEFFKTQDAFATAYDLQ